jgi:hypothetical protein
MKRACAVLVLGLLAACGGDGGSSSPTTPATPAPTPTPVTYNGTYTGTSMTYTGGGGQLLISASTTITQSGSSLILGTLQITSPVSVSYGMGAAVLTGNTFDGTSQYQSSACGIVSNHYRGYFSGDGNLMNLTASMTSNCGNTEIRGEMRR